jgi:hypothetical protein
VNNQRGRVHTRLFRLTLIACIAIITSTCIAAAPSTTYAQSNRSFSLPFAIPPGVGSWVYEQHYGNTLEAYNFGRYWYAEGQGLHFGIDFEAPCGTPVVAIGDGIVEGVDSGYGGAGPHNVVIRHERYLSIYGHLLEQSALVVEQPVKRGDLIGYTGDPDLTCTSRPHLHLEIRSHDYRIAYNPIPLIDADWDMLSSLGQPDVIGLTFAKDINAANRWQREDQQPNVRFGDRRLNRYELSIPPPLRTSAPPATLPAFEAPPAAFGTFRQITQNGCCTRPYFEDGEIRYVAGREGERAAVYGVPPESGDSRLVGEAPAPLVSADGRYEVQWNEGAVSVVRRRDGQAWSLFTRGTWARISPGSRRVMWHIRPADDIPGVNPPRTEVWVSDLRGDNAEIVALQQGGFVRWLDDDRLLMGTMQMRLQEWTLTIYNIRSKTSETLAVVPFLRALTVAPGGQHIMYYTPFEDGGMFLLETRIGAEPERLPFFGGYRWRDSHSVVYIPFEYGSPMRFETYDIRTGESRPLDTLPFTVANSDWDVSPDGRYLVFVDSSLAIWSVTLTQDQTENQRETAFF